MISTFKNRKVSLIPAIIIMAILAATTFTSASPFSDRTETRKEAILDNLDKNLILYYSFENDTEEKVFDTSGMDLHAQVSGGVLAEADGKVGKAKEFNGTDSSIVINDFQLKEFTFSAWVKSYKEESGVNNRGLFLLHDGDKSYSIQGNGRGGVGIYVTDEFEINEYDWKFVPGKWSHVAVTYDGRETRIYIDGKLSEAGDAKFDKIVKGTAYIGGSSKWEGQDGFWHGALDEISVFDRALTAKEVKLFYESFSSAESTFQATQLSNDDLGTLPQVKTDRGEVKVTQMPSSENDYTMIVRFDDNSYGGAGWYDIKMKVTYLAGAQQRFNIHIKAYIDGISNLVIKRDTAYWQNYKWAVPGRHGKNNYPTTINGIQWYSNWPDEKNNPYEPRGEQKSDVVDGLPFTLPQTKINVQIESQNVTQQTTQSQMASTILGQKPQWVSVSDIQGPSGYALKFDGASNFVRVPNKPSLEPKEEMTIEMWAYIDGLQTTYTRLLRKAGHGKAGYLLAADQNDKRMQIRFDFDHNVHGVVFAEDNAGHIQYSGQWHHFAGVYAKDYIAFYVDGRQVDKRQHESKALMHSPVDLYIGHGAPGGPTEYFKGMIDEVRIWNIARTDQQIQENMNRSVSADSRGLVAYWKFNEGEGNIAHDSTSNQNHGTLESKSISNSRSFRSPGIRPEPTDKKVMRVPEQSIANPENLPGTLIFHGRYHHRSRGRDIDTPSELWLKQDGEGKLSALAYLTWSGSYNLAMGDINGELDSYRSQGSASNNQAYFVNLEFQKGQALLTRRGIRQDCDNKKLNIPEDSFFNPNSRPDSYCADNIFLRGLDLSPSQMKEFRVYDWDNTGEDLVDYAIQIENAGKETITVPAGTFEANHYILRQITSADTWFKKRAGHITDYWILDNHIIVRIVRHREPYELELLDYTYLEELGTQK